MTSNGFADDRHKPGLGIRDWDMVTLTYRHDVVIGIEIVNAVFVEHMAALASHHFNGVGIEQPVPFAENLPPANQGTLMLI